jgi:hypothetical protein
MLRDNKRSEEAICAHIDTSFDRRNFGGAGYGLNMEILGKLDKLIKAVNTEEEDHPRFARWASL